jgi:hypothetical protein
MEVTCSQCNTKLNIPDEKIPRDQIVRIGCPKCKNRITIDARSGSPEQPPSADPFMETGKLHLKFIDKQEKSPGEAYGYDDYSDDNALDFFDEGGKIALIMVKDNDERGKAGSAMKALGYKCAFAENTRDALGKLRFHSFNMIFLSAGFDSQDIGNSPILSYLNRAPISSRRKMFVVLTGDRFKTVDEMMAFAMSANAVINTKDLDQLASILRRCISENEKFYKVLMDTLIEVGKD